VFLLFNYDSKISISLTFIFLFGGSLSSIWRNSKKKNPITGHSYVNYDLILLTLPISSAGAVIGVFSYLFRVSSKIFYHNW
jgi:uncharacterized membrane protein YfcA